MGGTPEQIRRFEETLTPQQRAIYQTLKRQEDQYELWSANINSPNNPVQDPPLSIKWEKLLGEGLSREGGANLSPAQMKLFQDAFPRPYLGWLERNDGSGGWGRWDPPNKYQEPLITSPERYTDPPRDPKFKLPKPGEEVPDYTRPDFKFEKIFPREYVDPEFKVKTLPYLIQPEMTPQERLQEKFLRLQQQQEQAYLKVLGHDVGSLNDTNANKAQIEEAKRKFAIENGVDPNDNLAVNRALREKVKGSEASAQYLEQVQKGIASGTATKDDIKTAQWLLKGQNRDMPKSLRPDGTMDGIVGTETRTALPEVSRKIRLALESEMIPIAGGPARSMPIGGIPDLGGLADQMIKRGGSSKVLPDLAAKSLMQNDELKALLARPSIASVESGASGVAEGAGQRPVAAIKVDPFKL